MVAVVLVNPKFPHNVGGAIRACAAFGAEILRWTGDRVRVPILGERLPREERLRAYKKVDWGWASVPLWESGGATIRVQELSGLTPVAVEYREAAEDLAWFEHPKDAVYVFGPEDGSLDVGIFSACHRFLRIPSDCCLNLAAAVNVVLADRRMKAVRSGG